MQCYHMAGIFRGALNVCYMPNNFAGLNKAAYHKTDITSEYRKFLFYYSGINLDR